MKVNLQRLHRVIGTTIQVYPISYHMGIGDLGIVQNPIIPEMYVHNEKVVEWVTAESPTHPLPNGELYVLPVDCLEEVIK